MYVMKIAYAWHVHHPDIGEDHRKRVCYLPVVDLSLEIQSCSLYVKVLEVSLSAVTA